jgi:hypothetical protein
MAPTVSLSTRVPPEVRDRLAAEAQARGVPLATYTRTILTGSVPGDSPVTGEVTNEVECVFSRLPLPEAGLERAVCLALARTVELGGTAGIAAGKELLISVRHAESFYQLEDEDEDGEPWMTPT